MRCKKRVSFRASCAGPLGPLHLDIGSTGQWRSSAADATGLSTALWASWSSQSESVGCGRHDTWQGSDHVGFLPFQAKEAILEMDSYCKYTLSACFVPNCAPL